MYGAGAKKLARILGRNENQGAAIKKEFYKAHPAIKELNDALVSAYRSRGSLRGIDGRPLYCRGENKLLNQLLQNAAAIVFKRWMVVCDSNKEQFQSMGASAEQMIAYHDEVQFEVAGTEELAKLWGLAVCEAALQVGMNWAQCH